MASTQSKSSAARAAKNKEATPEQNNSAGAHIGDVLRQAREERNLTLEAVADELMIRRFYLEALESGSFRDLPERVYASGFVRSYATYLGMDPVTAIEQFKRDAYGARNANNYQVELTMPEPMVHSVVPNKAAIITAFVVLAAVIGGIVYVTQKSGDMSASTAIPAPIEEVSQAPDITDAPVAADATNTPSDIDVPTTEEITGSTPTAAAAPAPTEFVSPSVDNAPAAPTTSPATPAAASSPSASASADIPAALPEATSTANLPPATTGAPPAAEVKVDNRLVIEALKTAWVEVKDPKGTILFTSILKEGQLLPLPNGMKLTVTTGNAGGLRLMVDGKAQAEPMGQINEVKRNIVLDPEKIFQR